MNIKDILGVHPVIQQLLGCGWGREVWTLDDASLCAEPADRIVVLHLDGESEGTDVRLCKHHVEVIEQQSTPHDFGDEQ